MGTPTNDKLRTYLAGRYLTADDDALTSFEADAGGSTTTIVDAALTEANGYWDGAFGWFLGDTTTVALRGQEFHVKTFTAADDTLLTAKTLPAAPAAGDTYKLVQGGKWRSAQESFGLTAGGVQPELVTSTLTNITGVTLKRVSPKIGTSGFTVFYDQSEDELYVKIAAEEYGAALDVSGDLTDAIVFGEDAQSYIQIDVTNGSLPGTDQTDIFTSAYASRLFIPDFEGYETTPGPKIRHRLEVVKNEDASDPLIGLSVYVAPPAGTATTIAAAESVALIAGTCALTAATDWPSGSFCIENVTKSDIRYVTSRAGNTVSYDAVDDWSKLAFDAGETEISVGDTVTGGTSAATGVVAAVQLNSGTWGGSDAAGYIWLYSVTDDYDNDEDLEVAAAKVAVANGVDVKGIRNMTAQAWEAGDVVRPLPDVDIGLEAPATLEFADPVGESTAPAGVIFSAPATLSEALDIGDLAADGTYGVWVSEWIMESHRARSNVIVAITYSWS